MFSYQRSVDSFHKLYDEKLDLLEVLYLTDTNVINITRIERLTEKIQEIDTHLMRINAILEEHRYLPLKMPLVAHKLGAC